MQLRILNIMWYSGLSLLVLWSCAPDSPDIVGFEASCGNDVIEAGELCDGVDIGDASCMSVAGHVKGTLLCNSTCDGFIVTDCSTCGDSIISAAETCDGDLFADATCATVSGEFDGGQLACDAERCEIITTGCARCGDGVRQASEACDGFDFGAAACATATVPGAIGALGCTAACTLDISACTLCGNGTVDDGEQCDGDILNDARCSSIGEVFMGGALSCLANTCTFNTSACHRCGNGVVDEDEACDDGDTDNDNACTNSCTSAVCGDGFVWVGKEICDEAELNGTTLSNCRSDCRLPLCGDGVLDTGEACDYAQSQACCTTQCLWAEEGVADPQGVCLEEASTPQLCDGAGACMEVPEELLEPVQELDGLPSPLPGVYDDQGAVVAETQFRALIGFPLRNEQELRSRVEALYDPTSSTFRQYLTHEELVSLYAPRPEDVALVVSWLQEQGMQVNFEARNRLLLQFSGDAESFNTAFDTELRSFMRKNPQQGNPDIEVYGTVGQFTIPTFVAERVLGVLSADVLADTEDLPGEAGSIEVSTPDDTRGRTATQIAKAYQLTSLHNAGHRGGGVRLGVSAGATFKFKDLQSFWLSMGVERDDPLVIETMEPVATRYIETTLDVQWAGVLAPEAEIIVYEGPDSRNTSMLYTWNEAIARAEVSVLTTSFAHREDSEPKLVREMYDRSALWGAALGMSLVAASGDSAQPDTPSSSPYVTAVGGTRLQLDSDGDLVAETAWRYGGSGITKSFPLPIWQEGTVTDSDGKRAVVDVALNASPASPYWIYYLGRWRRYGGTSFSAPVFAGLLACVHSYRLNTDKPLPGFLNPSLYKNANVRGSFRDIISGATPYHGAGPGWDYPTGLGAPQASDLAEALP